MRKYYFKDIGIKKIGVFFLFNKLIILSETKNFILENSFFPFLLYFASAGKKRILLLFKGAVRRTEDFDIWGLSAPNPWPNFVERQNLEKALFLSSTKFQHLVQFSILLFILRTRSYDNVARLMLVYWLLGEYEVAVKFRDINFFAMNFFCKMRNVLLFKGAVRRTEDFIFFIIFKKFIQLLLTCFFWLNQYFWNCHITFD